MLPPPPLLRAAVTKFKFKGKAGVDAGLADDMLKGVETQVCCVV